MKIDKSAQDHLNKILAPGQYCKISVISGGCNGYQYRFEIVDSKEGLDVFDAGIVIDKRSLLFLKNSLLVYRTTDFSGILSIENPDAKGTCGCKQSFNV